MNREQKLEEALRKVADTLDSVAQRYNGACEFASVDIRYGLLRSCVDDARDALSAPKAEAGEPLAWLRDLDGTGSLHVCAKGDPGAIAVYAVPALTYEAENRLPPGHTILEQAETLEGLVAQTVRRRDGSEYQRVVDDTEAYGGQGE